MALYTHLWTNGPAPVQLIKVRFYREFGWTPDELKCQPAGEILEILAVWEVEGKVDRARNNKGKMANKT